MYGSADKFLLIVIYWKDYLSISFYVSVTWLHLSVIFQAVLSLCLVCLHSCRRRMSPCYATYLECYTGYTLTQR